MLGPPIPKKWRSYRDHRLTLCILVGCCSKQRWMWCGRVGVVALRRGVGHGGAPTATARRRGPPRRRRQRRTSPGPTAAHDVAIHRSGRPRRRTLHRSVSRVIHRLK